MANISYSEEKKERRKCRRKRERKGGKEVLLEAEREERFSQRAGIRNQRLINTSIHFKQSYCSAYITVYFILFLTEQN